MDTTLIRITIACIILGAGIAACVIALRRRNHDPLLPDTPDTGPWVCAVAAFIAFGALMHWFHIRDERIIAENAAKQLAGEHEARNISAGYLPRSMAEFTVDLNLCPPQTDGMTDQVVMAIATRRDGGHEFHGCSRIAQRGYLNQKGNP